MQTNFKQFHKGFNNVFLSSWKVHHCLGHIPKVGLYSGKLFLES